MLFESKKTLAFAAPFNAVVLKRIWLRILIVTNTEIFMTKLGPEKKSG